MNGCINKAINYLGLLGLMVTGYAVAGDYPSPVPLKSGAQAAMTTVKPNDDSYRVAYMPPATEFAYYLAIGEGINQVADSTKTDVFMLAPQSGADINAQMGMIQDVLTQDIDAIVFSTHDEHAAEPLIKRAVDKGIAVIMINSDIPDFPTPIHGVVGYAQRNGTQNLAKWVEKQVGEGEVSVGIIEGQPGYHSTERVGGFLEGIKGANNINVVSSIDGKWNVEGGNTAAMDMLQSHPDIKLIFAANDNMAIGAGYAAKALGRRDITILGNDGDTAGLEEIASNNITATVNTSPYEMGQIAMRVVLDTLNGKFEGGWIETPTTIVHEDNVVDVLRNPDALYPKPSREY
ncbi:sugar ABC transporter substrate-binding protein [Enterovibrio calviensis]|uniref:sugar ABC transporter substrate-binding protein n=1 Tax=Enterovibrio calviensis TaxID=91359 RepID=UPI0004865A18|nr:sugar ABC transporter substrate-binding protein [Enterovibrio calviensis]